MAWPMPLAAPVTKARLPCRPLSGIRRAVDVDRYAGHVRSVVGAKRDDERRAFGDRADAAHGNRPKVTFRPVVFFADLRDPVEAAARDHAGRHAIDAYAELAELEGELAGHRHDAALGHGVSAARAFGTRRNPLARGDRGDIHDRAALFL